MLLLSLFLLTSLDQAWDLAGKGRAPEAMAVLRELLRHEPKNADAKLLLGSLLIEAGDCGGSLGQLQSAVQLRPRSAEAVNTLGEAQRSCGDRAGALESFKRAVVLDPRFAAGQLDFGQTLLEGGDGQSAGLHLDAAIRLFGSKDDAADAHYFRAKIDADAGSLKSAAEHLEKAVALRPNFGQAWSDLGFMRSQLGEQAGVFPAYKQAVAILPDDAVAQYRLGAEYLRRNEAQSALSPLREAYRVNPRDQSTLNALQAADRATGRTAEADAIKGELRQLLREQDRESQNALTAIRLNNEGTKLEKSGDLPGALAKYREAFALAPDHNGIRVNFAIALLRTGDWTNGLNQLHEAAVREPANPSIQTALRDALAQAPPAQKPAWAAPQNSSNF